ncbi:UPF0175 family protein [Kamptonema cortianum]|nr:UPF0175 family protein [Oscillatoria laete-virens]MDK3159974.1 UPF0175 family protein [Kamptonema cortianum]MDL5055483.1 UPF0175 family protein [Oscillatoria laete-virens NRMC-F 0139]
MTITIEYPERLPDFLQESSEQFEKEAKLALSAKLYELGRISSGVGAQMCGMTRSDFLLEIGKMKVSVFNSGLDDLEIEFNHA